MDKEAKLSETVLEEVKRQIESVKEQSSNEIRDLKLEIEHLNLQIQNLKEILEEAVQEKLKKIENLEESKSGLEKENAKLSSELKNLKDENKKLKVKKKSQAKPRGSAKKRQWVMQDLTSESDDEAIKKRNFEATGYTQPMKISSELEAVIGVKEAPRHEVIKRMWAYIKENNLQDPKNKQFANCDEKLEKVIGESRFKCFGMAKYLQNHMYH